MYLPSCSAFQVSNVGLIWLVNAVTHSALYIAIVGIANTVSTVVVTGILAVFVAGTAVGALIGGRVPSALAYAGKINILTWGVGGRILLALLGLFAQTSIALVASLGIGLGLGFGNNLWLTAAQNLVPIEMRGRYFAIDGLLSFIGGLPRLQSVEY